MTSNDIVILLGAVTGLCGVLAGGVRWLLTHLSAERMKSALEQAEARVELHNRLHAEIVSVRLELAEMRAEKKLYLRRIFQLEQFIHQQQGMQIPSMEGWPPV